MDDLKKIKFYGKKARKMKEVAFYCDRRANNSINNACWSKVIQRNEHEHRTHKKMLVVKQSETGERGWGGVEGVGGGGENISNNGRLK